MTRGLPFTEASVARAIKGVGRAGLFVVGVRPDGTLIVADKPIDVTSLVPVEAQTSRPPKRRFGERLNGAEGKDGRPQGLQGTRALVRLPAETGEALIKGFRGSREDLDKKLAEPDLMQAYNRPRLLKRSASGFPVEALGGFIHWYTNGDIDRLIREWTDNPGNVEGCYPKWPKLAKSTRQDYLEAFDYLRPEFEMILKDISQPDLYYVRDICAVKKWPRFADQMISALSSMFRQAVRRGKMPFNPCLGMDDVHKADPNANREWYAEELTYVRGNAPMEVLIPVMLARFAGLRGQTLVDINRKQFIPHKVTGSAVRYRARENNKWVTLPVLPDLQTFLTDQKVQRADGLICVRDDGTAWASEKEMQTRVSHWLRDRERDGHIGAGTTLHGLRVSYAAWSKRATGATNREVADLLGDESEAMGAHYTRHVEVEANINRAFSRLKDGT